MINESFYQKLRRSRRGKIVRVYYGIKKALEVAVAVQPEDVTLVSVENGVWEILADGQRVGGVLGSYEVVATAARLTARKAKCELIYDSAYAPRTGMQVTILQFKIRKPNFIADRWLQTISKDIQLASV